LKRNEFAARVRHSDDDPGRAICAIEHMHASDRGGRLATKMYNICVNTAFLETIIKINT
jgi:hypothetical protein